MASTAMQPFGRALRDYLDGEAGATVTVRREDGFAAELPIALYFRDPAASPIERAALALCRPPALDAGAGAGIHSLALQERGVAVTAIDISPEAVDVMRRRGVRDARHADVFAYEGGPFATVLLLQHGIGLAQTVDGLRRLLHRLRGLLAPGGEIVCDSLDVARTDDPRHLAYQRTNREAGRYPGEIRIRMEYGDLVGPWSGWLHVDPATLRLVAEEAGFACTVELTLETGDYLARLRA